MILSTKFLFQISEKKFFFLESIQLTEINWMESSATFSMDTNNRFSSWFDYRFESCNQLELIGTKMWFIQTITFDLIGVNMPFTCNNNPFPLLLISESNSARGNHGTKVWNLLWNKRGRRMVKEMEPEQSDDTDFWITC